MYKKNQALLKVQDTERNGHEDQEGQRGESAEIMQGGTSGHEPRHRLGYRKLTSIKLSGRIN